MTEQRKKRKHRVNLAEVLEHIALEGFSILQFHIIKSGRVNRITHADGSNQCCRDVLWGKILCRLMVPRSF